MINVDLMRSYNQYKKHQEVGHIEIRIFQRIMLSILFFLLMPLSFLKWIYTILLRRTTSRKLYVFPFTNTEPMKTILEGLSQINNSVIIIYPKAFFVFPSILLKDFSNSLINNPLWTIRNLDFFGALALKVSQYYGYKLKYNISILMVFQEYSFYSSYLTRIFENEKGSLYNIMHGIPGKEASYFRFTKCFVWGEYFRTYYIRNKAERSQFVISGSIYHTKLQSGSKSIDDSYKIIYALQGDTYGDIKYIQETFEVLKQVQKVSNIKIAVKPHPIYSNKDRIPKEFDVIELSPMESITKTKLVISHFSTIFLDAKVMGKQILAFLPEDKKELVAYLDRREIAFDKIELYDKIIVALMEYETEQFSSEIIDLTLNSLKVIENEIY